MAGPFQPFVPGRPLPIGGMQVGNSIGYQDSQGQIHPTAQQAINSNMGIESDLSRGSSGGCPQSPFNMPGPLKP